MRCVSLPGRRIFTEPNQPGWKARSASRPIPRRFTGSPIDVRFPAPIVSQSRSASVLARQRGNGCPPKAPQNVKFGTRRELFTGILTSVLQNDSTFREPSPQLTISVTFPPVEPLANRTHLVRKVSLRHGHGPHVAPLSQHVSPPAWPPETGGCNPKAVVVRELPGTNCAGLPWPV